MHARDHVRELAAVRTGLFLASVLCLTEAVGGYLTNSLALVSDAAHVLGDVGALGLTLFALWVGTRPASDSKTFGYHRAEILAALVNGVILWVVGILIVIEAWQRLQAPPAVAGPGARARHRRGPRPPRVEPHDRALRALGARGGERLGPRRRDSRRHGGPLRAGVPDRARDHPDRAREPAGGRAGPLSTGMVTRARDGGAFAREVEHTADLGLEIEAPTLPLLFERTGLAMLGLVADLERVEPRKRRAFRVEAEGREDLLRDWLQALVVALGVDGFLACELEVEELSDRIVRGTMC